MVRGGRQKFRLNKPTSVGFCLFDLSKLVMYKFYYETLKPKYGDRLKLLFTDTDSLCCEIKTKNLYRDMEEDIDLYDTSNFDPTHPLHSKANHRVLGKMKSKTGSTPPLEFVGLKAKMYSLLCENKRQKKIKEIKKNFVKKHVRHENFVHVLQNPTTITTAKFRHFESKNHVVRTMEINKSCLSAFDDKRYVLDDGAHTLVYGHESIARHRSYGGDGSE